MIQPGLQDQKSFLFPELEPEAPISIQIMMEYQIYNKKKTTTIFSGLFSS